MVNVPKGTCNEVCNMKMEQYKLTKEYFNEY